MLFKSHRAENDEMLSRKLCFILLLIIIAILPFRSTDKSFAESETPLNQQPEIELIASPTSITIAADCPQSIAADPNCQPSDSEVTLTTRVKNLSESGLKYKYSSAVGRFTGKGQKVKWNLAGVTAGTYKATVEVEKNGRIVGTASSEVTIEPCRCMFPCPTISISCPTEFIQAGTSATVSVNVSGGDPNASITYNWRVSAGTITSGQGSSSITIDTSGLQNQTISVTVEIGGLGPECQRTASCSFMVAAPPACATISVDCPTGKVAPGRTATVTATVSGLDVTPDYNWTVSDGRITSGQGTPTIKISTAGVAPGKTIVATLIVTNIDITCPTGPTSCSILVDR